MIPATAFLLLLLPESSIRHYRRECGRNITLDGFRSQRSTYFILWRPGHDLMNTEIRGPFEELTASAGAEMTERVPLIGAFIQAATDNRICAINASQRGAL